MRDSKIYYPSGFEPFTGDGRSEFLEKSPKWSPDGSGIAYLHYDENRKLQIYFIPMTSGVEEPGSPPASLILGRNYPDPFNGSTLIPYSLTRPQRIEISVYNLSGQKVRDTCIEQTAGDHTVRFSGTGLSSELYIFVLKAGDQIKSEILMHLK